MSSENPVTLGEFLRQERQKQGITIEQVASATKINVRTLQSLEADHYQELPAKPFIRGFVTSYCRFIGLDPKEVLKRFAYYIDERQKDRPNREGGHSGYAFERREGEQTKTLLWIMMGSCIVLGALMILIVKPSLHKHRNQQVEKLRESHPEVSPTNVPVALPTNFKEASPIVMVSPTSGAPSPSPLAKPSGSAVAIAVPSPSPKPTAAPSPSVRVVVLPSPSVSASPGVSTADPLNSGKDIPSADIKQRVKFRATDDVLIRYQVDEKPVMKFFIRKGGTLVLHARDSIKFQCSNPAAMTYKYKNDPEKTIDGDPRAVIRQKLVTLFFPPELTEKIEEPFPNGSGMRPPKTQPSAIPSPSP